MTILAIDPGPVESAWVVYDGRVPCAFAKWDNRKIRETLDGHLSGACRSVVIESVASYGMPVGVEVFETVWWAGRFHEIVVAGGREGARLPRKDVKLHLCHSPRANDATIRQALIDKFGGKDVAIGKKAAPGPLYGLKADCWQALALGVTWWETRGTNAR